MFISQIIMEPLSSFPRKMEASTTFLSILFNLKGAALDQAGRNNESMANLFTSSCFVCGIKKDAMAFIFPLYLPLNFCIKKYSKVLCFFIYQYPYI